MNRDLLRPFLGPNFGPFPIILPSPWMNSHSKSSVISQSLRVSKYWLFNLTDETYMSRRTEEEVRPTVGLSHHRHFVGFFNVPVKTRGHLFYSYSKKPSHFSRLLRRAWGYGIPILILNPRIPKGCSLYNSLKDYADLKRINSVSLQNDKSEIFPEIFDQECLRNKCVTLGSSDSI